MTRSKGFHFFKSRDVSWSQGIHLQRARWHNCMQWGWDSIRADRRAERWGDYWVLHICWRTYGVCWHYYPKSVRR